MNVNEWIINIHGNDNEQLEFINSTHERIILTAAAGCGKTTSLISKIVKTVSEHSIKSYQHILCMSFSVNAALNMKRAVHNQLTSIFPVSNKSYEDKIDVSNYHNFALKLLFQYGKLIDENLGGLNEFKIVPDEKINNLMSLGDYEKNVIKKFNDSLKKQEFEEFDSVIDLYSTVVKAKFLENKIITYNAIIVLALELLNFEGIFNFINNYYGMIAIDEFQDTNYLQYKLVQKLIKIKYFYIIGDDCQKIYSFLGAINKLLNQLIESNNFECFELRTNHRLNNIRLKNYVDSVRLFLETRNTNNTNRVLCNYYKNQEDSADKFIKLVSSINNESFALLVRYNVSAVAYINKLKSNNIEYFDGRFLDSDEIYSEFHGFLFDIIEKEKVINSRNKNTIVDEAKCFFVKNKSEYMDSLLELLSTCIDSIIEECPVNERKSTLMFIISTKGLKHYINKVSKRIYVMTIHGSKGLEWDNIFLPEINDYSLPSGCSDCKNKFGNARVCVNRKNNVYLDNNNYNDELSLYYVGVTRARKELYLTYTQQNAKGWNCNPSCFLINLGTTLIKY